MTTVLVVDDSAADRRLVGELLKGDDRLGVEFAVNGVDALAKLDQTDFDLVVTDLVMPHMNGLELVAAIRDKHPLVPVILTTSRGNDEIAVRALREGAASYVPKRKLAWELLDTVHGVLAVSHQERSRTRLMGSLSQSDSTFVLTNDCALFGMLVTYLLDQVARMGICNQAECIRIGVALEEALANALYHGNLGVASQLREEDGQSYSELIEQRRHEEPYRDRRIYVRAQLSREEARFEIRDEGTGFDPTALPDPTEPANLEKACGRGVLLMRTLMDEVIYHEPGNAVTLVKRCNTPTGIGPRADAAKGNGG